MAIAPEFASVEAFVTYCMDDERTTFVPGDAQKIAVHTKQTLQKVMIDLKSYGLTVKMNGR
jgi:hypothetical protein